MIGATPPLFVAASRENVRLFLDRLRLVKVDDNKTLKISVRGISENEIILLSEAFRHIMLTKIPGSAITRLRIDYRHTEPAYSKGSKPVLHKYSHIPGVSENMREITENFQQAIVRLRDNQHEITVSKEISFDPVRESDYEYREIYLGDIIMEERVQRVVNPDLKLMTLCDKSCRLFIEIQIERGVGYRAAAELANDDDSKSVHHGHVFSIALDANFNPITRVGYHIEKNQIFFEIDTNGSISAGEAFERALTLFSKESMTLAGH